MPGHVFLEGTDVTLRVVDGSDRDRRILGRVRNDPTFRQDLGFDTPWSSSRVQEFVESSVADESSINLFVCLCEEKEPQESAGERRDRQSSEPMPPSGDSSIVGAVNLFDVDSTSGTLSYWLFEEHRGNGYATEAVSLVLEYAFTERGLRRVEADVFEGNDSSEQLLERLGFVHEGTARDARYTGGEFTDTYQYGLLAPEWADGGEP